jgi:hypothetical protein
MYLAQVFERFAEKRPVSVMARAAMEHAMAPAALDELFTKHAERQYVRELLFSSVVDLMGVVVCKIEPSLHAAYQAVADTLPVSVTSVYNKLNGIEPPISCALVHHTADRLGNVIRAMGGQMPDLLPGYRVRILDGNHLAATERRLEVLRASHAGPLPGQALVVLEPALMLATDMIPCEDGHAQERSLSAEVLRLVAPNDLWIADRNFCTTTLLTGIADKGAFFVIRHHSNLPIASAGTARRRGRTETGEVYEQSVTIRNGKPEGLKLRRITVRLLKATRDGDTELAILTNLPEKDAGASAVANLYRKRWTLETMFQTLTQTLQGELDTLGYPRAALLGFAVALAAYNVQSTVQAALRASFGVEKVQEEVSAYYIANEVRASADGMSVALTPAVWRPFQTMKPDALAKRMLGWAGSVQLSKLKRHPRGPKKPVPKRTRHTESPHVSTARLLAETKGKRP